MGINRDKSRSASRRQQIADMQHWCGRRKPLPDWPPRDNQAARLHDAMLEWPEYWLPQMFEKWDECDCTGDYE